MALPGYISPWASPWVVLEEYEPVYCEGDAQSPAAEASCAAEQRCEAAADAQSPGSEGHCSSFSQLLATAAAESPAGQASAPATQSNRAACDGQTPAQQAQCAAYQPCIVQSADCQTPGQQGNGPGFQHDVFGSPLPCHIIRFRALPRFFRYDAAPTLLRCTVEATLFRSEC